MKNVAHLMDERIIGALVGAGSLWAIPQTENKVETIFYNIT